jgi:hypothetical protein
MKIANVIEVNSYLEAAGVILALRQGISLESLSRPLPWATRIDTPERIDAANGRPLSPVAHRQSH